jgi:hypothetical protein
LDQQKTVVKVKQRSIASSRMKRLMVVYEFSNSTIIVTSHTVGLRKFNSFAVKYASGTHTAPKTELKRRIKV